jgi:hypothetical protein
MSNRKPDFYCVVLKNPLRYQRPYRTKVGYWNGHSWKLRGSGVPFQDSYFENIIEDHPVSVAPEEAVAIRGSST